VLFIVFIRMFLKNLFMNLPKDLTKEVSVWSTMPFNKCVEFIA
jgi:hypothetical protein